MSLKNGLHVMLSREEYDKSPRANFSKLKLFERAPAYYRHAQLDKADNDTDAYRFGRCGHLAVYEPEEFMRQVIVWDGGRRNSNAWRDFEEKNAEREILTEEEYQACISLQSAVRNHPVAGPLCRGGKFEVTIFWTYEAPAIGGLEGFSVECKSRLDFVSELALPDLKTCVDASPNGFGRAAWNYLYLAQAAFYSDAYFSITGRRPPSKIIAAEKKAPFVVQVYSLTEEQLAFGRNQYRGWLDRLHLCRETSNYPGYAETEIALVLPKWSGLGADETDASGLGLEFDEAEGAAQ